VTTTLGSESGGGGTIVYDSGLYWIKKSVSRDNTNLKVLTVTSAAPNIHAGGLVKIGGTMYLISNVTDTAGGAGNVITLDGSPLASYTTAYFALANVVNNTVTESETGTLSTASGYGYGYYGAPTNDDGDRMIESVKKSGTTWTWEANVCSKNIPDGPIELHYVAFDAAGNYSIGIMGSKTKDEYTGITTTADSVDAAALIGNSSRTSSILYVDGASASSWYNGISTSISGSDYAEAGFVSNNAPRIAGFVLKTDYNSNNSVEDSGETVDSYSIAKSYASYYTGTSGGSYVFDPDAKVVGSSAKAPLPVSASYGDSGSPVAVLRGMTKILPEIVGGNNAIYYEYNLQNATKTISGGSTTNNLLLTAGTTDYTSQTGTINVQLGDLIELGDTSSASDAVPFTFTFWDSTDGTTPFTDSQKASLTVYLAIQAQTIGTPSAAITPFYWKSASDNSLYGSSTANGHIELDIPDTFTDSSGELDNDPKVSGKVRLRGTASDDKMVRSLYMSIPKMAAQFAAASLGTTTVDGTTYYKVAEYDTAAGTFTGYGDLSTYGFAMEAATVSGPGSNGHTVSWTLSWDTSMIDGVAATDADIQVLAFNEGLPATAAGGSDAAYTGVDGSTIYTVPTFGTGEHNTPDTVVTTADSGTSYYKVDVVPYITGVTTKLSGMYKKKASAFARSAKGWYPVYYDSSSSSGETITISGFNLNGTSTAVTINGTAHTAAASGNDITVAVGSGTTSGALQVTVSDVYSLNNLNDNNAVGTSGKTYTDSTYAYCYNREPNGINNDTLTDDRYIYVWNLNQVVSDTSVRYPTMRVGKDSSQTVGFIYDKGSKEVYVNQGGTDFLLDTSYTQWYDTAIAIDDLGRFYGSAQNGDSGGSRGSTYSDDYANYAHYKMYAFNSSSATGTNYDSVFGAYSSGGRSIAVENCYYSGDSTFYAQRIRNPKIVAVASGTSDSSAGTIYTAYYDSASDQVRFRCGTATPKESTSGWIHPTTTYSTAWTGGTVARTSGSSDAADVQVIAGSGASSTANESRSGKYVAVGVVPSGATGAGTAVVAWYSSENTALMYSYNTDPTSTSNVSQWGEHTITIDDDFAGWYVDMTVDAAGGVHIAYYGASDGDLRYAYLPTYGSTSPQVVTVDSFLSVGTNISIDTKAVTSGSSTYYVPYISYYMSAFTETANSLRVAWLDTLGASSVPAGVDNQDGFTGSWECMTIPLTQVPLNYTVGIGLKDYNTSLTERPILGFGTSAGLETAQLK